MTMTADEHLEAITTALRRSYDHDSTLEEVAESLLQQGIRAGEECPDGCGCRKGSTDADSNDCACGGPCCMDPEWGPPRG